MDKYLVWQANYLAELARKGAALVNCGKMCKDCAFKPHQEDINGYAEAVERAMSCVAYFGQFHCHTPNYEPVNKICVGFRYAQAYLKTQEDSAGS